MTVSRALLVVALAACGTSSTATGPAPAPTTTKPPIAVVVAPPTKLACRDLPAAACAQIPKALLDPTSPVALARCTDPIAADQQRVGTWRYALVAPLYTPTEDVDTLPAVAAAAETIAALHLANATPLADARPTVDATHWAVIPADQLLPAWKVITVATAHPLTSDTGPLAIPLCAPKPFAAQVHVDNIDPAHLTQLAMTGTTAPTRYMARLMDQKGVTYPARDVADWFAGADFVHVSNEVSFTPGCKNPGEIGMSFCARETYIQLLEQIHASIIELDGSHLIDHGTDAFAHTLDLYAARGWHWFGGGRDQLDATKTLELEHHGNKIALVGCNMPKTTSHVVRNGPNVAACDLDRIAWQIGDLKRRGFMPIVSIQHEEVYVHDPPDVIVRDFRKLAEQGAAVVFGSQAHCAHPFETHYGAFVHYGAGNFWFDQEGTNTRDGTVDRIYVYDNRVLTVGHLYTRLEENGRPRPLTDRERAQFLGVLATAQKKLVRAKPWETPHVVDDTPAHPDSFLFGTQLVHAFVLPPADFDPAKKYALVITTHGSTTYKGADLTARGDHFVFAPYGISWTPKALAAARAFATAKYAIDPSQVTISK